MSEWWLFTNLMKRYTISCKTLGPIQNMKGMHLQKAISAKCYAESQCSYHSGLLQAAGHPGFCQSYLEKGFFEVFPPYLGRCKWKE